MRDDKDPGGSYDPPSKGPAWRRGTAARGTAVGFGYSGLETDPPIKTMNASSSSTALMIGGPEDRELTAKTVDRRTLCSTAHLLCTAVGSQLFVCRRKAG